MPDPTPAAATPAVLPLSAERQKHVLHVCASRGDVDYCDECFDEWPCQVALLGMLDAAVAQRDAAEAKLEAERLRARVWFRERDAARADLAEFARQTREAQASMMAAIKDKEDERKRAESLSTQVSFQFVDINRERERANAAEAALQAERNRRRWAETRASHWRREWYLTMDTLGVRSNELGRANLAHRTALAQERQRADGAEGERDYWRKVAERTAADLSEQQDVTAHVEAALADERARGERLVYRVANVETGEVVAAFAGAVEGEAFLALPEYAERHGFIEVLAAPASPAAEPADQTTATAAQGE